MKKYRKYAFDLVDFSVEIKHLPKLDLCADSDQLKAKLALHIAEVIKNEKEVLNLDHDEVDTDLTKSMHHKQVAPDANCAAIASIHFGYR